MNISPNWRDRRFVSPPLYYPCANYSTHTKNDMTKVYSDDMFFHNLNLGPDPLRKNLADTMVTTEKITSKNMKKTLQKEDMNVKEDTKLHQDFSPLSGISNFISGMVNVITNAMFYKRKPEFSSYSDHNMALPSMWHDAKHSDENKNLQADHSSDDICSEFNVSEMGECKAAAAHCQSKLDRVRSLLGTNSQETKPKQCAFKRRQPKKVFVDPTSVEDHFEDAFSPEDFENVVNDGYVEYFSPVCNVDHIFHQVDAPRMKIETGMTPLHDNTPVGIVTETVQGSLNTVSGETKRKSSETHIVSDEKSNSEYPQVQPPGKMPENLSIETANIVKEVPDSDPSSNQLEECNKKKIIESCEDKMAKLKLLLQNRCKKTKTVTPVQMEPDKTLPKLIPEAQPLLTLPPRHPSTTVKDKRLNSTKTRKCRKKRTTDDDGSEDLSSSVEGSPCANNMDSYIASFANRTNTINKPSEPKMVPTQHCFNEVAGCFQSSSFESDDSFQIVFHDSPTRRRSSECDSEDSFIIFEESPDSCYTSNEVFGDSNESADSEDYDSESDDSDSGCGVFKLTGSLSKSVYNLADDSLYENHSEDEVDCGNVDKLTICDSVTVSDDARISNGVLLDDRKKLLRKNLPAKRVHFSPDPPKVHVMRVWLYAAQQTRCRYWQQFAVDRERFKRRIADVDMAVSWTLKPQHRSRVMFQRFMPWWNAQKRKEIAEKKEREAQAKLVEEERLKIEEKANFEGNLNDNTTENTSFINNNSSVIINNSLDTDKNTEKVISDNDMIVKQYENASANVTDSVENTKKF